MVVANSGSTVHSEQLISSAWRSSSENRPLLVLMPHDSATVIMSVMSWRTQKEREVE